jgi:hypothetical protein
VRPQYKCTDLHVQCFTAPESQSDRRNQGAITLPDKFRCMILVYLSICIANHFLYVVWHFANMPPVIDCREETSTLDGQPLLLLFPNFSKRYFHANPNPRPGIAIAFFAF